MIFQKPLLICGFNGLKCLNGFNGLNATKATA